MLKSASLRSFIQGVFNKMSSTKLLFVAVLLSAATTARADSINYLITVDTESISGSTGFLDFQFNPGPNNVAAATATLENYSSSGTLDLNGLLTNGDVSGNLPGTVTFDNGTQLNEYSPNFTFGASIQFQVVLSWTQPDVPPDSGSLFSFYMFQDATQQYVSGDSSPDGRAFDLNVNADGTTPSNNYSSGSSAPATISAISSTPEPGSMVLMSAFGLVLWWGFHTGRTIGREIVPRGKS